MILFSNAAEGLHGWIGCDSCLSESMWGRYSRAPFSVCNRAIDARDRRRNVIA